MELSGLVFAALLLTGLQGGSDFKPFARAEVPFVRFFGNFFPDYHKSGDIPERREPAQELKSPGWPSPPPGGWRTASAPAPCRS